MAAALPATDEQRAPPSADRVPTLTEVVELVEQSPQPDATPPARPVPSPWALGGPWAAELPVLMEDARHKVAAEDLPEALLGIEPEADLGSTTAPPALPAPAPEPLRPVPAIDAQELVTRTLGELSPHIEQMFQARLREALAPALARAADGLIRDARHELDATLQELVQEAVSRVLLRLRDEGSGSGSSHLPPP